MYFTRHERIFPIVPFIITCIIDYITGVMTDGKMSPFYAFVNALFSVVLYILLLFIFSFKVKKYISQFRNRKLFVVETIQIYHCDNIYLCLISTIKTVLKVNVKDKLYQTR